MGRFDRLMEVLPPLDWDRVGKDQWGDVVNKWLKSGGLSNTIHNLKLPRAERTKRYEDFLYELRQPDWWQGDKLPHPAPLHVPVSLLEQKLFDHEFVITAEVAPPLAASSGELVKKFNMLRGFIDAVNFTDNPSATSRMSPLAASVLCLQNGLEPVMQIASRDYNRMGVQSTILGASALGIRNILCLTGDHSSLGPHPHSRMDIWDINSIQLVWMLRRMRDEGRFLDQRNIDPSPPLFIGAAASPNASLPKIQAQRELKKVNAGVQFFQTNLIYDIDTFKIYLECMDIVGALGNVYILAGVAPIRSAKAANMMNQVPGITIPAPLIKRLEKSKSPKEEGVQIALELIDQIKDLPCISGIHFMAVGWKSIVPRIIEESGLRRK